MLVLEEGNLNQTLYFIAVNYHLSFVQGCFLSIFSLAQEAIAQCVQDARNFAKNLSGPERKEIMDLADDVERLSKKLADLKRQGKVCVASNP